MSVMHCHTKFQIPNNNCSHYMSHIPPQHGKSLGHYRSRQSAHTKKKQQMRLQTSNC